MDNLKLIIDSAEKRCQLRGKRLTNKRKLVLKVLLKLAKALSAYEIIDFCKLEYGETMLAMSVYRILEFLEKEHLVHKLYLANKYVACSCIADTDEHDISQFLICRSCYKVKEININSAIWCDLQDNIEQVGFTLTIPQLEINCLCNECKVFAA